MPGLLTAHRSEPLGAPLGPLGIVAGGLIGGVLGGWIGSSVGDAGAAYINDKAFAS